MTALDSTTNPPKATHFQPFQWHREETQNAALPGTAVMHFASEVHDISNGAHTILQILESDGLAESFEERKLLGESHRGYLLRMAIASLGMLGDRSQRLMDWAYEHHTPEGQKEKDALTT